MVLNDEIESGGDESSRLSLRTALSDENPGSEGYDDQRGEIKGSTRQPSFYQPEFEAGVVEHASQDPDNGKHHKVDLGSSKAEPVEAQNSAEDVSTILNSSLLTQQAMNQPDPKTNSGRRSPLSTSLRTSPSMDTVGSPATRSPAPPRTRNRGFSLRRSILARSIHKHTFESGSNMELQPPKTFIGSNPKSSKPSGTNTTIASSVDHRYRHPKSQKENHTLLSLPNYERWVKDRATRSRLLLRLNSWYQSARKVVLRIHDIPPSKAGRRLYLDVGRKEDILDERTGRGYVDNVIRSSRYTLWNFLPRQLFAQFSKLANFYFLCVSILQMIPGLSTTGNFTTIVPLLFFISLSMAKEGYDDFRRYKLDKAENNRTTYILHGYQPVASVEAGNGPPSVIHGPKHWANTKWKDVRVGDVVRLVRDEAAPADLVVLNSKGTKGIAYIETMALDGETNLKSKQALTFLASNCENVDGIAECDALFIVEDPNLDLYNFEGTCTISNETLPLTNNEIIYRGSILRNTPELYGMVIYSGEECKIRMNATKNPRIKAPALQGIVNKVVIIIVLFVLVLAIFNTAAYQIWVETTEEKAWYLIGAKVAFFPILASFIILFNTMIPLSLYVSLEIVKLFQLVLMNDVEMYDEDSNTPMEARTSTINEDLGQVSYIFSDKTGTLTNNSMRFRKMSVAGTAWLHDLDIREEAMRALARRSTSMKTRSKGKMPITREKSASIHEQKPEDSNILSSPALPSEPSNGRNSSFFSQRKTPAEPNCGQPEQRTEALLHLIQNKPDTAFARRIRMFLLSMALCHTCIPEKSEHGEITFQGASPDEQALVQAAQELGFIMIGRQNATITLKIAPVSGDGNYSLEDYQILDVIEFSSSRKRMSVVVRMPDGRICVFCKGADSVVSQRLRLSGLALDKAIMAEHQASERQSLEAQKVLRRNSEHQTRTTSIARSSLSINRHSIGGIPRPSMAGGRLRPIRDEWLRDRETDADSSTQPNRSGYHSPKVSFHYSAAPKISSSGSGLSFQGNCVENIVDDPLVMDDATVFERCFQDINDFATEGLRTLLYGYRYMDNDEYQNWKKVFLEASTSLNNRQEMIEKAGDLIETGFELVGATAIEDKLQEGVPGTIDKLRRAKIKIWMLTGDKRETAINIGHSCRLIKDYSLITILDQETGDVNQRIAGAILELNRGQTAHSVVVIDGQTLVVVEENEILKKLFIDLAILADSVICCRASPRQKAYLVSAIRRKVKNAVTLAIGDGANDIAMIQEAHVGIGITGKEGLQAARTSDYSIAQFRFLLRLLLVHGRWNYIRTCKYTLGTFWKEMLFYLTQALYQRYVGYTGTSLYESWSLAMFNTLFTSLPVIFIGIFEKDLAASTLLAVPELYDLGHHNRGFNLFVYAFWIFMASAEAMIVFFVMVSLFGQAVLTTDNDLYSLGTLTYSACVVIIAMKLQFMELHNKSITCVIAIVLSIGGWVFWNLILSATYTHNDIYDVRGGLLERFGRNALWWFTLVLIIAAYWIFEIAVKSLQSAWAPSDVDLFQELEKDAGARKRLEMAAGLEGNNDDAAAVEDRGREEEKEAQRREDDIVELLKRPRAAMGDDVTGSVRRRELSETIRRRDQNGSVEQLVEPASHDARKRCEEKEKKKRSVASPNYDSDDSKIKKDAGTAQRRRSGDVQRFLKSGLGSARRSLDVGAFR